MNNSELQTFPPKRKYEFLNYVMLVYPKDEWSDIVMEYIIEHKIKNWQEGFDFIVKWANNSSIAAYLMTMHELISIEWAKSTIENDTSGDPSFVAYLMVRDKLASVDWAKSIVENATSGTPSEAAYYMALRKLASSDWAKSIIENDTVGTPSWAARNMIEDGLASLDWYNKHFGKSK